MSFGFPANPSNKKQYVTTDGKSYEYDSTRGAWAVGIRPASSANTVNITDVSQLVDPDNLLSNASSTLPVYATEESLYASTADLDVGQMAYVSENGKIAIWNGTSWLGATTIEYVPPPSNLVINGDFSTSDLSGWTEQFGSITITNNALYVTRELGTGWCSYYTLTNLSVGTDYTLSFDISPNATNDGMRITETLNTQVNGIALSGATSPGTTLSGTFTATQTTMYLISILDNPGTIIIDNISVEPD